MRSLGGRIDSDYLTEDSVAKILIMTDNANIPTGMGRVGREIALGLQRLGHEIIYLGWFSPTWLESTMPFRVYRTSNNYYGSDIFDRVVHDERPDVVLTVGDIWMVQYIADPNVCRSRPWFQWIGYVPIDGVALNGGVPNSWISVLDDMDVVVPYTEYGKEAIGKSLPHRLRSLKPIPHGVDTKVYHPLSDAERMDIRHGLGIRDDRIVFLTVARNQFRKNIPEFCKGWKLFRKDGAHEKAVFWPHMGFQDPMGWDLSEVFSIYDIGNDLMYFERVALGSNNVDLLPEAELMKLYNAADIFILMSGEGWGLPTLEAMACGKPCILMDHSANTELIGRGIERGLLVDVAGTMTGAHSTERPFPDLNHLVKQMSVLYEDAELRRVLGARAAEFAKSLTWDSAVLQWNHVVETVVNPLTFERELEVIA